LISLEINGSELNDSTKFLIQSQPSEKKAIVNGSCVVLEVHNTLKDLFALQVRTKYGLIWRQKLKMLMLNMLTCFLGPAEAEGS
jgi:hypothetical protein